MFGNALRREVAAGLVALLAISASSVRAALIRYDLGELTRKSSHILCGRVTEVRSYWGMLGQVGPVILTDVTIRVDDAWKTPAGAKEVKELTVQVLGGRIGERWQYCSESPRFAVDEEVLVFARTWNGRLWTTGWAQGKYRLLRSSSGVGRIRSRKGLPLPNRLELSTAKKQVAALVAQRATVPQANPEPSIRKAPGGSR